MTTAKDLVDAIQSGKSATIQATFNSLMTEKIQEGIETYRQAVIDNTFNPELDEVAYDTRTLDDKKKKQPVIARGVKGMKSTPFEKKFPSMAHYEKWADSEASGNHEVHDVRLHESEELDEEHSVYYGRRVHYTSSEGKRKIGRVVKREMENGHHVIAPDNEEEFTKKWGPDKIPDSKVHGSIKESEDDLEEDDQSVDELSTKTLKSYYKKAMSDRSKAQATAQKYSDKATTAYIKTSGNNKRYKDLDAKADTAEKRWVKRTNGTDAAGKRLGYWESEELQLEDYSLEEIQEFMESEDFDSLDELSKQTLTSYRDKAYADSSASGREGNKQLTKMDLYDKGSRKYNDHAAKFVAAGKRHAKRWAGADRASEKLDKIGGIRNAVSRLTKESEEVSELSKQTLTSYRDKAYADSSASGREGNKQLTKMDLYDKGSRKYNDHAAKFVAAGKRHAKRWAGADRASEKLDKIGGVNKAIDKLAKD